MNNKDTYYKITNKLIKKSFSELKGFKIKIKEYPNIFKYSYSFSFKGINYFYIFLNKNARKRNKNALKGQIAHELCHLAIDYKNKNFLSSLIQFSRKIIGLLFNTNFFRKNETNTDKETIQRGYGKELIKLKLEWEKTHGEEKTSNLMYKRGYLNPKEIKKLL